MTTPDRDGPPDREGWRARARGALAERLGLKLTALAIAVLLWFVVRVVHGGVAAP